MKSFFCLSLSLIILFLALSGCEDKVKPSVIHIVETENLPQQESWDSKIVVSDSGRITAIIYAGYVQVYEFSQQIHLKKGVKVHFFNREGKQTSILTSNEGIVDETTNNLEAIKNVFVVSNDSSSMTTEKLMWDNSRKLIYTNEYVSIVTPKEIIKGHGFESDENLKNYRIFRVTGKTKSE